MADDTNFIERFIRERDEARECAINWEASCREAYADLGGQRACTMAAEADRDRLAAQVKELRAALSEARDALNGAPNTVGLHAQIDHALAQGTGP